jgi:hypothetical protein
LPTPLNQWQFVCGVGKSNSNRVLYVNAKATAPDTNSNVPSSASDRLTAGASDRQTQIDNYYKGKIDDVRIYNRALSAQEIQQLYLIAR